MLGTLLTPARQEEWTAHRARGHSSAPPLELPQTVRPSQPSIQERERCLEAAAGGNEGGRGNPSLPSVSMEARGRTHSNPSERLVTLLPRFDHGCRRGFHRAEPGGIAGEDPIGPAITGGPEPMRSLSTLSASDKLGKGQVNVAQGDVPVTDAGGPSMDILLGGRAMRAPKIGRGLARRTEILVGYGMRSAARAPVLVERPGASVEAALQRPAVRG
jgi:hypothetical protein